MNKVGTKDTARKVWNKPLVRSVIPSRRTSGGFPNFINDQDDGLYSTS